MSTDSELTQAISRNALASGSVFQMEPDANAFRLMRQVLLHLLAFDRVENGSFGAFHAASQSADFIWNARTHVKNDCQTALSHPVLTVNGQRIHSSHQPERASVRFGISNGGLVLQMEPDASAFRLVRHVLLRLLVFGRDLDTARLEHTTLARKRLTPRGAMMATLAPGRIHRTTPGCGSCNRASGVALRYRVGFAGRRPLWSYTLAA